ncbi:uncharacterized protein LOC133186235 [Saccostrea echinata]|uniref:uncharacterized protein LOC133186235 n=1 Tax=Saccostrea echinata TaxID=191078 RepID=UPI002A810930|nr:uncharacterized protein LOC133186235 [Saccostrea echinata]
MTEPEAEYSSTVKSSPDVSELITSISSPTVKLLLDEPEIVASIETGYEKLLSVTRLGDEEIWTRGNDTVMNLYNLQGKMLKSVLTKSGEWPHDIAVMQTGELVYTDPNTRSVNVVRNELSEEVIKLEDWEPNGICITFSGELLVTMFSDDAQSKTVRYSGSTEKQTLQFDDQGKPYFSSGGLKHITESKNLDMIVSDYRAKAVFVFSTKGKLRFIYTGNPNVTEESFNPLDIATDSQCHILIVDFIHNCIHILDQKGIFLRYLDSCDFKYPMGIFVDTKDYLYVAELAGRVKKIKYMQ